MNILSPDFLILHDRTKTYIGQLLHLQAIEQADKSLSQTLPSKPIVTTECKQRKNGMYTAAYLDNLQLFDKLSWFFHDAFISLSYAYCMTKDNVYLDKFCEYAQSCLINARFGPAYAEYDHCSSRLCRALAVACSWLKADLPQQTKRDIDARLIEEIQGFLKKYERAGNLYPIGPNDHQCKDLAGAGIACIYLLPQHPELNVTLDRFIYLYADKFVTESATEEGGWIDGYELIFYALMDTAPFMEAVLFHTGRNIASEPRLRNICRHIIYGQLSINASSPSFFRYTHGLFYLASTYRNAELQHYAQSIALDGLSDPVFAAYSLLYYDPSLEAVAPMETVHIAKDFGLMRLGKGIDNDHIYVWLRSGPAEAFNRCNQNGILLTAYGVPLLSNVTMPGADYKKLWNTVYNEGLFTTKCTNALLIDGKNQLTNKYGEDWAPIAHFHKPDRPKWGDPDAWWFDFEESKQPLGRALCAIERDGIRVISGNADNAYGNLVRRYTRHVVQIEENLIVIIDVLNVDSPRSVAFRACTNHSMHIKNNNVILSSYGAHARLAFSHDAKLSVDTWSFQPKHGCYLTAVSQIPKGEHILASAIRINREPNNFMLNVDCTTHNGICNIKADGYTLALPCHCFGTGDDIRLV